MRTTFVAVLAMCAAAFIGCSNNSTAPTQVDPNLTGQQPAQSPTGELAKPIEPSNTIHVDQVLIDPLDKGDLIEVVGDVQFGLHELASPNEDEVRASISFSGQAFSSLIDGPEGYPISGKTTKTLELGLPGEDHVELTYVIQGFFEPLNLHVRYIVTDTKVQVEKMWLVAISPGAGSK